MYRFGMYMYRNGVGRWSSPRLHKVLLMKLDGRGYTINCVVICNLQAASALLQLFFVSPPYFKSLMVVAVNMQPMRRGVSVSQPSKTGAKRANFRISATHISYFLFKNRHLIISSQLKLEIFPSQNSTCTTKSCNLYPKIPSSSRAMTPHKVVR